MGAEVIVAPANSLVEQRPVPALVVRAGAGAMYGWEEFLARDNANTNRAYRIAIVRFLDWAEEVGLELGLLRPSHISGYVKGLTHLKTGKPLSDRSRKLHLTSIRQFFDYLVLRHAVLINPAASVKGPRETGVEGKTPAVPAGKVQDVIGACDTSTVIGLRDRAIIGVLAYTAVRAGAVAGLRIKDYYTDGMQYLLNFREKGGKARVIPVRHDLQGYLTDYMAAARLEIEPKDEAMFRTSDGKGRALTTRPMRAKNVLEMVKRRFNQAALPNVLTTHSFRASVVTNLLEQGVPLEDVQQLAGHADPRTTRLYDRTDRKVTRNMVERISF